jgi:serine/threonine protein kinase
VENERDALGRFQHRTPYLRPLIDEIKEPSDPPTIVLKYLDDHLLNASVNKTLNRKELKYVSRRILEALKVLHEDGYVHTGKRFTYKSLLCLTKSKVADVKLDNVFVNYPEKAVYGSLMSSLAISAGCTLQILSTLKKVRRWEHLCGVVQK